MLWTLWMLLEGGLIYVLVMADRKLVRCCQWITCFMAPWSIAHNSPSSLTECSLKAFFLLCRSRDPLCFCLPAGRTTAAFLRRWTTETPPREEQSGAKFRPWHDFKTPPLPYSLQTHPPWRSNSTPPGPHLSPPPPSPPGSCKRRPHIQIRKRWNSKSLKKTVPFHHHTQFNTHTHTHTDVERIPPWQQEPLSHLWDSLPLASKYGWV